MGKRLFLQKAQTFNQKIDMTGQYISEKLDGMRFYWDGGITTGMLKSDVPWANMEKDERYLSKQYATGFWSFYGNIIQAPKDFIDQMPKIPLDGEMFSKELPRQDLMSIIKKLEPDSNNWKKVKCNCFDMPAYYTMFSNGIIDIPNYCKVFRNILDWIERQHAYKQLAYLPKPETRYESVYWLLNKWLEGNKVAIPHPQHAIPYQSHKAEAFINGFMESVLASGGEGVILRKMSTYYECERSWNVLKLKPYDDMEGTVIGYITGRVGKLQGLMGALVLKLDDGGTLELSGFTDEERQLVSRDDKDDPFIWAYHHVEERCPESISALYFPVGSRVTFKYRGLSNDGIPQEARYFRRREDE